MLSDVRNELEKEITAACLRVGQMVVDTLRHETIYGFALCTSDEYLSATNCVFTKVGLAQAIATYSASRYSRPELDQILRWSAGDSPYHQCHDREFHRAQELCDTVWIYRCKETPPANDDERYYLIKIQQREMEILFLRALSNFNRSRPFGPEVVVTLMLVDQSDYSRLAYAELFNQPNTVQKFRTELLIKDEHLLEKERARIPNFEGPAPYTT